MKLPFHIPQQELVSACQAIIAILKINDESLIFSSVNAEYPSFVIPTLATEYLSKYEEINNMLDHKTYPYDGSEVALKLINKMLAEIINRGHSIDPYISCLRFTLIQDSNAKIFVDSNRNWMYESLLYIRAFTGEDVPLELKISLLNPSYGILVPEYIAQYLHAAQLLFRQRYFHPCLALCSIVLEATLKDILEHKGLWDSQLPNPKYNLGTPPDTRANIRIGGLGNALIIARHDTMHKFLFQTDLLEEFDSVLYVVRNNLVHLSEQALQTALPELNGRFDIPIFTLAHFMKQPLLMGDVLNSITKVSSKIYERLRNGSI